MVVLVRFLGVWLAFFSVLGVSPCAVAAGSSVPPYLRTALDDGSLPLEPREPRRIRSTLDDPSHASFPLDAGGRLIRVSLDEGVESYGHLNAAPTRARRVRTQLD
jgi:hypothetical protein